MELAAAAAPPKLMITNINAFNARPADVAPTVSRTVPVTPQRNAPMQARVELSPRDAVDAEAGTKGDVVFQRKDLGRRLPVTARQAPQQQRQQARQKSGGAKKADKSEAAAAIEDAAGYLDSVEETLDMLRDDSSEQGRADIESMLSETYTPIEKYRVLLGSLQLVDEQNISNYKKKQLKNVINEMLSDLTNRDSSVRNSLQEPNMEALNAESFNRSLVATAQADGAFQAQLSPLTLLGKIIQHFSVPNTMKALNSVGAQLLSGL